MQPSRFVCYVIRYVPDVSEETGIDFALTANIRLDPQYMDRALRWENCIRVFPPREIVTSDFEDTFVLLSSAELGIE